MRETCQGTASNGAQMDALASQAIMQHAQERQASSERLVPGSLHIRLTASSTPLTDVQVQAQAMPYNRWSKQQQRAGGPDRREA